MSSCRLEPSLVLACPLSFTVFVVEESRYRAAGIHVIDGDPIAGPAGQQPHEALVWVLGVIPVWALPFGIIGAALGAIGSTQRGTATVSPTGPVRPS